MSRADKEPSSPSPVAPAPERPAEDKASIDSSVAKSATEETLAHGQAEAPGHAGKSEAAVDSTPPYIEDRPGLQPDASQSEAGADAALPRAFGRYEVRGVLGKGHFGTVYIGYDNQLHRDVAIKVPHLRLSSDQVEQQFLQEARRLAQLKHSGIVTVFDVGVDNGRCYIISDYLKGPSLFSWLKQNQPNWQESVRIVAALAEALAHAHAQRTVHRDLKPGNVILVEGLKPVIVDFGLAVSDAPAIGSQRGMVTGTPAFMAPEQARGEGHRIDGRTDIYALGVILYRMLTGRLPFQATELRELLQQIQEDEPQPPRQLVQSIPRPLERICLKALAKQLRDRYTTAADMAQDLQQLLSMPAGSSQVAETVSFHADKLTTGEKSPEEASSIVRRAREAERRRVTVLQCGCDLFESEEILETLDPEEQHELLVDFQRLCKHVVERFEGTVVRSTDHGLLICFGFPVAFEDSTPRAVRSALKILERMPQFNERVGQKKPVKLSSRFAVHSDFAVVREEGSEGEALSIVGPVLSVVDQLEGLAEPDSVVISDDTYRLVKGFFQCQSLGCHRIRGVSGAREVHRVQSERLVGGRIDIAEPIGLTPLIGRDREVGLLDERWEQAAEGMGQVVLLVGESGIGKSRLVHVLKEHVLQQHTGVGSPIIEWRCTPHYQNSSLFPAIECFERILGFGRQDPAEEKLDKLVGSLERLGLDREEEIGLLASLLSIPLEGRYPPPPLSPERQKEKTLDLLSDWLREYSRQQPVLFIVEDLHWVDPTTLEFLELLVEEGLNDSILALFTFRPEFEIPWKSKANQTQVALNRLTKRQVAEMMVQKSGLKSIPQRVLEQVAERTDGVPLFVEEFTAMILESGRLREVGGELEMSDTFPIHEIPATLQDLLMARLDRMASNPDVVQLAATVGREFTYELLHAVCPLAEEALQKELAKLVQAELLFQRGRPPRARYQFKHALIQDAAYQSLLKKKRQQFHQRIAEVLEKQFPETCGQQPELLAHHFTEANLVPKAVEYWDQAGKRSLERCAHHEAIGHLSKGLELLRSLSETRDRNEREIKMHITLGVPLQSTKGYSAPEVEANYARAHELCQRMGAAAPLFPVLYGLFRYYMLRAQYARAQELGEQLRSLADKSQNPGYVAAAHRALGATLVYQGEHPRALPHLEKMIALDPTPELRADSYRYDVVDPWITCRSYLSWSLWLLGYPDRGRAQSRQAISTAQRLDHPFSLALALSFASWLHQFCHEIDLTSDTADKALAISTEQKFAFWLGWGKVLRGWTMAERGQSAQAIAEIRQGLTDWRGQGSELGRTYFLALLAQAYAKAGRVDDGLNALAEAQEFADTTGEGCWAPEIQRLKGELLLTRDATSHADAEACFGQALELARRQQAKSLELRAAMSLGRLWRQQGKAEPGRQLLAEIYGWFTEGFDTHDLKQVKTLLDEWS